MTGTTLFIFGIAAGLSVSNLIQVLMKEKAGTFTYCDYCKYKKNHR